MDKIFVKGMKIYGYHGILEEEKRLGQNFIVSVELFLELSNAGIEDNLTQSIDYSTIYAKIKELSDLNRFNLIEAFAENIAQMFLKDKKIKKIKVCVEKPSAPINGNFKNIGVEIER